MKNSTFEPFGPLEWMHLLTCMGIDMNDSSAPRPVRIAAFLAKYRNAEIFPGVDSRSAHPGMPNPTKAGDERLDVHLSPRPAIPASGWTECRHRDGIERLVVDDEC